MSGTPVEVTRTGQHAFMAVNPRGGKVAIGREDAADSFTPGELLLAAIAGCSALTGENLLVRRLGQDAELTVRADRTKSPEEPHKFASVQVSFNYDLSGLSEPERSKLVETVQRAVDKYCTVSRSVTEGTPVEVDLPR